MASRVKVDFSGIEKNIGQFRKAVQNIAKEDLKKAIIDDSILLGISPVEGERKFDAYSQRYTDAIKSGKFNRFGKKPRPINLNLSGDMLESFFVKASGNGLVIGFNDEKAVKHTVTGVGYKKTKRKMLPISRGEDFKRKIKTTIVSIIQKAMDRILAKK